MIIQAGKSYKAIILGPKPYKTHVLAIIEGQVVYKYYGRHKQKWFYEVKALFRFKLMVAQGEV